MASLVDRYALIFHVKSKKLYVLYPALTHLVVTFVIIQFFPIEKLSFDVLGWAILGGLLEVWTLYYLFTAISLEQITKVFPLSSLTSFLVLFLSWLLLNDPLSGSSLYAFFLFVAGGTILGVSHDKKKINLSKALKPLLITGFVGSFQIIVMKHVFNLTRFWTGFFYSRIGLFIGGLIIFLAWQKKIIKEWKKVKPKTHSLLFGNQIIAVFGHVFVYFALSLANSALVSSAYGIQHIMIFLMATFISIWKPEILKEELTKKEILKKAIGTLLVIAAIYFLNV
ncbi:hypothetical protein D6745_04430 [Candidatus Woesearchaeota archaeon]|nr:MAG: hypothetical protein D6745_04430 [Candidatus Woesearchaeota archaeon]